MSGSLQFWLQLSRLANRAHNWGCRVECGRIMGSQTEVCWQLVCSGLKMPHTLALRWGVSTLAPSWIQGLDSDVSPVGNFLELRTCQLAAWTPFRRPTVPPSSSQKAFLNVHWRWEGAAGFVTVAACLYDPVPSRTPLSNRRFCDGGNVAYLPYPLE